MGGGRRNVLTSDFLFKAIDPANPNGPKVDVTFPGDLTLRLYKYSSVRYENLRAAKYVLENTERIFFGVREFSKGGWCYTGRPVEWYIRENIVAPFPEHMVFAVYLNPNMRVYECRAEHAADDDPLSPVDWQKRYRGRAWKSTS